jgi:carbonic anhydrase/acetyltransferase-like protein (isoleucine patch superfamily)
MPLYSFEGKAPQVSPDAWIAPTASLIGDVTVEAGASIWYGAVLRADFGPIIVRSGANVQDCSVVHGPREPVIIGEGVTIGHICVVHGATLEREALIGNGATVQDGVRVGERAMVAAGTLVPPNTVIEPGTMFRGTPGSAHGPLAASAQFWVDHNQQAYRDLSRRHAQGITEVG